MSESLARLFALPPDRLSLGDQRVSIFALPPAVEHDAFSRAYARVVDDERHDDLGVRSAPIEHGAASAERGHVAACAHLGARAAHDGDESLLGVPAQVHFESVESSNRREECESR